MKTLISLKPELVRTGAMEKFPEEVAGCSSCLTGHQHREEARRDVPSSSLSPHCSPMVKSNSEPDSKKVWVLKSPRVNFAAHGKSRKGKE